MRFLLLSDAGLVVAGFHGGAVKELVVGDLAV
jgi:hypothetical protein